MTALKPRRNMAYRVGSFHKYGVLSSDGQYLIEPLYDSVYEETGIGSTAFYKVSSAGKFGLINTDGTSFIPVEYDGITVFDGIGDTSYYQVESNTKVGFLNADGTSFIPVEYDGIAVFDGIAETSYYQVENNSKVGFLNADGTSFIPVEYDEITLVKGVGETSYYQVENNTKIGFLNADGTVFIPVEYDDITLGTHEYFVKLNGKVGVATLEGTVLISPAYASVTRMDDGRYLASEKSLYGVIDMTGKIIVPLTYSKITLENTGTYTVTLNSKYGIVAYDGTVVHEPNMEQIRAGSNDGKYLMFKQDGLYGFLDASTFEVVVEAEWKNATIMYDGYAYIYNNLDKWGVISATGKVTVSPQWSYIKYFDDCGCALRSKDGSSSSKQCYLMNEKGSLVCDFSEHSSSTALYVGNGCFTDSYGEMLYDSTTSTAYAYTVNNGDMSKLRMLDNGLLSGYYRSSSGWDYTSCYGVVNPKIPEILSNVAWEEPITILPCRNRSGDKYGWINESGKDMIRATYDYIRPFTVNGYIVAANYNDRGNLVYMLLDATTGSVVVRDIKTEAEAINYYDAKAMDSISLHEKIIVSLINMGFDYESSEKFLAALLAEDDYTAEDLYESTRYDTYGTTLYKFWDDIEYDIDDGDLNTEEKVWRIIQKYVAN